MGFREKFYEFTGAQPKQSMVGYDTSRGGKKSMKGWRNTANSPNADVRGKLDPARGDSRDLAMNTPLANAILSTHTTNTIGPGLIPQSVPDFKFLGITKEVAKTWSEEVERRFDAWSLDTRCDARGQRNFYDLQSIVFRSILESGDIFAAFPWKKQARPGLWPWETCIQVIEADLIRDPVGSEYGTKDIINGIEFNAQGQFSAIHVADSYPGANDANAYGRPTGIETKRIAKYGTNGRQNVHHIMLPFGRPGQRRTMPWLTTIVDTLKSVATHTEAEIQSAVVTSMFTVFVKDTSGVGMGLNEPFTPEEADFDGGTSTDELGEQTQEAKEQGHELEYNIGPGTIVELDEDKDISIADPRRANNMYTDFHDSMAREVCSALDLSYEQVMRQFDSSYSASRAALQEAEKTIRKFRLWFTRNFVQPAFEMFLEEEVVKGRIDAPGFLTDLITRKAWARAFWVGPANGMIDPQKEAKASVIRLQNGLTTHSKEFTSIWGERWDNAMVQLSEERDLMKELGMAPVELVDDAEEVEGPTGKDPIKPGGQTWG
jgi:lambda family phage portal protein